MFAVSMNSIGLSNSVLIQHACHDFRGQLPSYGRRIYTKNREPLRSATWPRPPCESHHDLMSLQSILLSAGSLWGIPYCILEDWAGEWMWVQFAWNAASSE